MSIDIKSTIFYTLISQYKFNNIPSHSLVYKVFSFFVPHSDQRSTCQPPPPSPHLSLTPTSSSPPSPSPTQLSFPSFSPLSTFPHYSIAAVPPFILPSLPPHLSFFFLTFPHTCPSSPPPLLPPLAFHVWQTSCAAAAAATLKLILEPR